MDNGILGGPPSNFEIDPKTRAWVRKPNTKEKVKKLENDIKELKALVQSLLNRKKPE